MGSFFFAGAATLLAVVVFVIIIECQWSEAFEGYYRREFDRRDSQECSTMWVRDYPYSCPARMELEICDDQKHGIRFRCSIRGGPNYKNSVSSNYRNTEEDAVNVAVRAWNHKYHKCLEIPTPTQPS